MAEIPTELLNAEYIKRKNPGCCCSTYVADHDRVDSCNAHDNDPDATWWYRWRKRLGQALGALLAETGLPNDEIVIPEDVADCVQGAIDLESEC